MRFVRFETEGTTRYGVLEADTIRALAGDIFGSLVYSGTTHPLADVRLRAPVAPSKVIGIGFNYRSHAKELNVEVPSEPGFFVMPPSAVIGPGESIVYPPQSRRVEYEGELAVVIGRRARHVTRDEALSHVLGYTCCNDVTARDIQFRTMMDFVKAKTFDTFAALGPWIETGIDPTRAQVRTFVNGTLRQSGCTDDLVFDVATLVSFLSTFMTLEPGDVIATGTPFGVGEIQVGDQVTVLVEDIGELTNTVAAPAAALAVRPGETVAQS